MVRNDTKNKNERKPKIIIKNKNIKKKNINKDSLFNIKEVLSLIIITMIISLFFGFMAAKKTYDLELSKNMKEFITDFNDIRSNYYKETDEKKLLNSALKNVINNLDDPYSTVVDSSLSNSINTELKGSYSGIGIQVSNTTDNKIIIVSIIKDSPAVKAGLKAGDIIKKINNISIEGKTTDEFVNIVKSTKNPEINLMITRDGKEQNITIVREIITLKSIESNIFEKNGKKIAYIYLSVFAENTDKQFNEELKKLEKQGFDSLIIDVRDNTGGHLSSAENIMSSLLDKTHVIYQIESKNEKIKHYSTGSKTKKYPIAVLINNNSASASEMLTAALKEEYKAEVIGEKSFGKGTVQEIGYTNKTGIEYKLTTKKWLTPNGNWINKKGIEPTVKVVLNNSYKTNPTYENDNQLQKAIEIMAK